MSDDSAFCTDNAASMNRMRDIPKGKHAGVETRGCPSPLLKLGRDVTPESVISHVVKMQKRFRNHHRKEALLSAEANTVKREIPYGARWTFQTGCVET